MIPHVNVVIVGDDTFGKPVGQIGLEFCDKILRPTAFELANADGAADYFDGLPVTPGCEVPDDLSVAVGDPQDPNMIAAMSYLNTGSCPAPVLMSPEAKGANAVGVAEPARQKRRHRDLFDAD
jgi:carboxyl-terminal processing protease